MWSENLTQRISVVTTLDGSQTLEIDNGVEHYHSTNGAIAEAIHVYIEAGLAKVEGETISVFEVGFGTGLNAMLASQYALDHKQKICYRAIERYPLPYDITQKLNYPEKTGIDRLVHFDKLHAAPWNTAQETNPYFTLTKFEGDLTEFSFDFGIDVVFFDAFSPELQPELWSEAIFARIYKAMSGNGRLVTYSSKGMVKSNLRNAGFTVSRLPGANGKRHMVLAQKTGL